MNEKSDWRAEPNPDLDQIDNWRVCYEIAGIRYDIAIELEEQDARLIANAFAKARLCEELADALETLLPVAQAFEKQASKGSGGRRGGSVFAKVRAVLKLAGRSPQ